MIDKNRCRIALAVGALPISILLGACGNNPGTVTAGGAATVTESGTTVTVQAGAGGKQAAAAKPQAPAGNGLCKAGDVKLSLGNGDTGAGTTERPLIITNASGHDCTIQGFPGISYVGGADGHQIGKDAFRAGTKGNAVKLASGQAASAAIGFVQVANFDPGTCKPEDVKGLRVYLPQETASLFLSMDGTGCSSTAIPGDQLTVKTVHAGTAG
jgi:hypothetical protein